MLFEDEKEPEQPVEGSFDDVKSLVHEDNQNEGAAQAYALNYIRTDEKPIQEKSQDLDLSLRKGSIKTEKAVVSEYN